MENNFGFSQKEIEEMLSDGTLTEDDVELFASASAIAETVDLLPDDTNELLKKLESVPASPNGESATSIIALAKTDPEFFAQLMALVDLADAEVPEETDTTDPLITKLSDEEYKNLEKNFFARLESLPLDKRRELIDLLNTASEDQKADLVNMLKSNN